MKQRLLTILPVVLIAAIAALMWWVLFGTDGASPQPEPEVEHLEAGALAGQVVDTSGRPVAGAKVFAEEAITGADEQGRFSFDDLPAEPLRVDTTADGHQRGGVDELGRPTVDLSDGEPVDDLELVLPRAASVSGRVVAGGEPVEGAELSLSYVFAEGLQGRELDPFIISKVASSGDDGRFSADDIAPGRLQILVESDEYPFAESDDYYFRPGQQRDDLIVDLAPSGQLYADVRDEDGQSVSVEGRLTPQDTQGASRRIEADDGQLRVRDLTEGRYELVLEADGYRSYQRSDVVVEADDTRELSIALEKARGLYGRVVEPDETPVEQAHVLLESDDGDSRRLRTDSDGAFEWEDAPQSRWQAVATSPRHQPSEPQVIDHDRQAILEVNSGGIVDLRVVDPDGRPVSDFEAEVASAQLDADMAFRTRRMPSERVVGDETGRVEFGPLQSGRYRLLVTTDEYAPATSDAFEVTAGATSGPVTVQLESGARIQGMVSDAESGEPITGAQVQYLMNTPDNRPPTARTDEEGWFEIDEVPSGRFSLRVSHGHYIFELIGGLEVGDGQRLDYDIDLEPIADDGQPGQNLQGIGASLSATDDGVRLDSTVDGGPAEGAGMNQDDVITAVDGRDISGQTVDQTVELIRGEPGQAVELTVDRPGRGSRTIEVERESVFIPHDRPVRPRE